MKTTFRYLTRDKIFSFINIFGLTVGLTAVLCITLFIVYESNYDNFHRNADRIYRVSLFSSGEDMEEESYTNVPPIGLDMKAEIPEVEEYARMSGYETFVVAGNDKSLKMNYIRYADTSFFDMFTFPLVYGDAQTVLAAPFSIVLTEESAAKIFGDINPVGQTLRIDMNDYTVTGVVKQLPKNSHIQFNALISFSTLYRLSSENFMSWNGGNQFATYLRLRENANLKTVKTKMQHVIWENLGKHMESVGWKVSADLHPLRKLHLYHDYDSVFLLVGIIIFSVLALVILAIACINFVNLTTARSMRRVREASMRKVMGSGRFGLVRQFLGESLMTAFVAFAISLGLFKLLQMYYEQLTEILLSQDSIIMTIALGFVFTLIIGIIGGSYPALRLSSLNVADAPKGGAPIKSKRRLQNALIVIQFFSSVLLTIFTIAIIFRVSNMQNMDLGFDKEKVLVVPLDDETTAEKYPVLKQRLQTLPEVVAVSAGECTPDWGLGGNGYFPEGMEKFVMMRKLDVDEHFLDVYGIKLHAGRFFSGSEQDKSCYVVNEALTKTFGWNDDALGKYIRRDGHHEIIGIVNDFVFSPLSAKVEPLIITNEPDFHILSVKYRCDETTLIPKIEEVWQEVNPGVPFDYSFFDEEINDRYKGLMRLCVLIAVFAGISIILAALGVLGLMAYTVERRKKEIGIRKVMGASVMEILVLLLRQTGKQLLIANVLAWVLAWGMMIGLRQIAFQIPLTPLVFILASAISLLAALLAVGLPAIKAATANPIKSISSSE